MLNRESNSVIIDLKPNWSELDKISDILEILYSSDQLGFKSIMTEFDSLLSIIQSSA
jgi:hypothetical protein